MQTLPSLPRRLLLATSIALASFVFGCSSDSAPSSGGPLGNPTCDGPCPDEGIPLDSSTPDAQFDVGDTTPPDTQGADAPTDAATDAVTDAPTDPPPDG